MRNSLRPGDPRQLGGYKVLSRLGEGGMGTVFLGRDAAGRPVAIKVVRPEFAYEDEFRARFRSEVTRARQVPPFCTAEVLDADPEHDTPYLVVEYVDGPSLADVVGEQGPLSAGNLHSVAVGVATALVAIHGAGVIHRDLKPDNVLFSLGTPKVIDFGIARALEVTSQHTRTDRLVGTVAYMAPERFDGNARAVTPAADVFAWGAVVGYAASGRTPFAADSAAATAARILTQPPSLTGLSGPLRDLVASTLEKDPGNRPTAHELLDLLLTTGPQEFVAELAGHPELRHAAEAAQNSGRQVTGDQPGEAFIAVNPAKRSRRTPKLLLAGLGVLAVAGAALLVAATRQPPAAVPAAAGSSAAVTPRGGLGQGPAVTDPLDRPGQWKEVLNDAYGSCEFIGLALVASTAGASTFRCPGPSGTFAGDQSIAVDAAIGIEGSCAEIWFRYVGESGYRVSACENSVRLALDDDGDLRELSEAAVSTFALHSRHRIGIGVYSSVAIVTVDGKPVTRAAVAIPTLAAGRVILGVSDFGDGRPGRVEYSNVEIRTL